MFFETESRTPMPRFVGASSSMRVQPQSVTPSNQGCGCKDSADCGCSKKKPPAASSAGCCETNWAGANSLTAIPVVSRSRSFSVGAIVLSEPPGWKPGVPQVGVKRTGGNPPTEPDGDKFRIVPPVEKPPPPPVWIEEDCCCCPDRIDLITTAIAPSPGVFGRTLKVTYYGKALGKGTKKIPCAVSWREWYVDVQKGEDGKEKEGGGPGAPSGFKSGGTGAGYFNPKTFKEMNSDGARAYVFDRLDEAADAEEKKTGKRVDRQKTKDSSAIGMIGNCKVNPCSKPPSCSVIDQPYVKGVIDGKKLPSFTRYFFFVWAIAASGKCLAKCKGVRTFVSRSYLLKFTWNSETETGDAVGYEAGDKEFERAAKGFGISSQVKDIFR